MIQDPPDPTQAASNRRLCNGWPILWLIAGSVWLIAIVFLLVIPTDPKNSHILGFSTNRLALLGAAFLFFSTHLGMAWTSYSRPDFRSRTLDPLILDIHKFRFTLSLLSISMVGIWATLLITDGFHRPGRLFLSYSAYIERLLPFGYCLVLECAVLLAGIMLLRFGPHFEEFRREKSLWLITAITTGVLLILSFLMAATGLGITPDRVGWGQPGVPLLYYQVVLAWLAGLMIAGLLFLTKRQNSSRLGILVDILVCLTLWIAAARSWSNLDVQRSYFAPSPTLPNSEIYPYSDAGYYDYQAQSLLLGYGFVNGQVVPRPLYILLLAGFHAIAGQGYEQTIYIQTLLLAILPIFLYLLGKAIHSRPLGISIGILAILRESNSILSTPWVEVSHSKLFLADLPTAIAVIALAWLSVRWFTNPKRNWSDSFLVGGVLGIAALLRTQTLLLLPALLLFAAWYYRKTWKELIKVGGLVMVGLILVISPWLIRNWVRTGSVAFDDPSTQTALLAQRYSSELGEMPIQQLGETQAEYAQRISKDIRQFISANPLVVTGFATAHTLNNLVSTTLVLPMRFHFDQRCDTLIICDPFWISILEKFTYQDGILLCINLLIVAFGIASSWRRWKAAGLIPLVFLLVYSLSNGLARNSARRYILPVDWVAYLYLMIGLFELAIWVAILFGASKKNVQQILTDESRVESRLLMKPTLKLTLSGTFFLLIGLSIPLAELSIHPHSPAQNKSQLFADVVNSPDINELPLTTSDLQSYADQEKTVALSGTLFYPRFYPPGEGEFGNGWPAYKPYEYRLSSKLGAVLIGPMEWLK